MANDPMFYSAYAFLNALDEESDSGTDGQVDDGSATESASFDRSPIPNSSQPSAINPFNNCDAEVEKKIVLFNLPESFGNAMAKDAMAKEQADRSAVLQVFLAINAEELKEKIQSVKREGHFDSKGRPRRVIVTFTDESAQKIAVECGRQLPSIRQLRHLSLYAYKAPAQRVEAHNPSTRHRNYADSRSKNERAQPMGVGGQSTNGRDASTQKFEQKGMRGPRSQRPPPSQRSSNNESSSAKNLHNDKSPGSRFQAPANSAPIFTSGQPNESQIPNHSFLHANHTNPRNGNSQGNGINGQSNIMMPNQQRAFPQQMFNSAFGVNQNGVQTGNLPPNQPPMMFNPADPQWQMMMMQMYQMYLNTPQNNYTNPPPNMQSSANEFSDESEESEESDRESSTAEEEEETNEEPNYTNQLFKAQSEKHVGNKKELNILVLGETGVGKSTWINGIANYLTFDTLEDALNARQPICLIASKFSFYETNEDKIDVKLEPSHGEKDENESFSDQGQSSTQEPKTYQFETAKYIVNIIDTPGIGDTRGVEQDKENTRKILGAIGQYKHLHAICFLFKANEARMTLSFRYCISEILLQLHKDAVDNIIFFFTNARGTFYKPGDTMTPLNTFLTELQKERGLRIALTSDKICCTDNEAFRLVCAHFNGAKFTEEDFQNFAGSWKQSAAETHRFIEFTARQRPHHVADTVSINKARTIIFHLAKPLADVNELIESNIKVFNDRKRDLQNTAANLDELKKKLLIPQIGIEVKPLNYPKTVCAAQKCIETIKLPHTEQYQTIYKQICHDHCYLTGVDVERVPEPHLQRCAAMAGQNHCMKCRCQWSTHMHIRFEQMKTSVQVEDNNTKTLIQQKQDATKVKEKMIKDCESTIDELKKEQQKIIGTSLRFGSFLQANAILPYNDAFEKYVEQTISEEEKCTDIGGDRSKLENLRKLLGEYRQEKAMLLEAQKKPTANGGNRITPDEIEVMKAELFGLRHTGKILKNLFAATEDGLAKHQAHVTVKYLPPKQVQPVQFGKYKKTSTEKEKATTSKNGTKKQQQNKNGNKNKNKNKNRNRRK